MRNLSVVMLSVLFVLLFGRVHAQQHNCINSYNPWYYTGERRVPTSCNLENLNCPISWKSGIPEGSETAIPLIYERFLTCHESSSLCGYVPIDPKSGEVLGQSGVTIGTGVDLGSKSWISFSSLPSALVDQLRPYFGLKGNLAACAAIERPLKLTLGEVNMLTDAAKNDAVNTVSKKYDNDKDPSALPFTSIPRGIRTAIVSVWYQFGFPTAQSDFWSLVTKNDWRNAIRELRNFYKNPQNQEREDLVRRNNEADIIEAALLQCDHSVDLVFLLDESGSVSPTGFNQSLAFVKNVIKAFPDKKLSGKDGTRFGLSTFSENYVSRFYLSSYNKKSRYLSAISSVSFAAGGKTYLGQALEKILTDQFTEARGLRPEVDGLPRILIVLTDGRSHDSVSIPAQNVRDENIVVYAIGVANYNLQQLENIASSVSQVYTLSSFSELEKFVSTITSSTCYEPRPAPLDETIITNVAENSYRYFKYSFEASSNLMINIIDLYGSTFFYASRTNPHPYRYDYDIAFEFSEQKNKQIVISGRKHETHTKVKRSTDNELTEIYVSLTSHTNLASFTIVGSECNPLICTEGTNVPRPSPNILHPTPTSSARVVSATKFMVVSFVMLKILLGTFDI